MKIQIPTWLIVALLVTGSLALVIAYFKAQPGQPPPPPSDAANDGVEDPVADRTASLSETRTTPLRPRSQGHPPPASLTAAYPDIKALPADWHDYLRETQSVTVAPYPDLPLTFTRTEVKDEGKYVTWFGIVTDIPGSSLVAVATPAGGYHSVMIMPGSSQFAFDTTPSGETIVSESQPGEEGCGVGGKTPDRTAVQAPTTSAMFKAQYTAAIKATGIANSNYLGNPAVLAAGSAPLDANAKQVRVLFVYDPDIVGDTYLDDPLLTRPVTADDIDGRSKAYIESGNVVLASSGVTNFQWQYLGSIPCKTYMEDKVTINSDGSVHGTLAIYQMSPGGAIGDWVTSQAYNTGAAQVFRWISKHGTDMPVVGQAQTGGKGIPAAANMGRACALWRASYKATIHELAHNFGCQHDRAHAGGSNSSSEPVSDGDGNYSYGVLWSQPDPYFPGKTVSISTIMGYGSSIIPYYSNPNITVHVTDTLGGGGAGGIDLGNLPIGLAVTDPKAAYNVKVLADNAATMAAYGTPITVPTISAQPQNVSVQVGSGFSLSVTASGGGLIYQWKKDGTDISGATASLLSKTAATGDAGNYTVTISNSAGSVTSNTASVSVTAAPPPSSGGSGGGGGGAPSQWFLGAFVVLAATRTFGRIFGKPTPG